MESSGCPIVIQARMSSRRLPGKMLRDLAGATLLERVVARASGARRATAIVVATSLEPDDDPIAAWCAARDVACHRGALDDVAARLLDAAGAASAFVRICGDSPFIDPALIDQVIEAYHVAPCDLATNVRPRRFPAGQSVEVVRSAALRGALDTLTADEREHVTQCFHAQPAAWRIVSVRGSADLGAARMVIDTAADLERWIDVLQRGAISGADADGRRWSYLLACAATGAPA